MSVDTLSLARELRAADLASPQAAAIGRAVVETTATKAELLQQGTELRGEIAQQGTELRGKIAQLGTELRDDIGRLGADLRTEIERSRNTQIVWTIGAMVTLAGLVVAIVKLIPALG